MANSNSAGGESAVANQTEEKSFLASAQETLGGAVEATVGAVKDHPVAAAAIAAGAAAAVGGAVYAATQMSTGSEAPKNGGKKS